MPLKQGAKLGQYEVRALIGAGGMGEVYRATDSRLGRDVAINVLPEQFARDPDRLARFQREAKLLASLNHPNIAAIYGIEESAGQHFLVMEMVEGATLAEVIRDSRSGTRDSGGGLHPSRARQQAATSGIALEEALDIAKQICEALEHAHEKPIIHRDLKPANVKVTPEGKVKVLDFGLAKAFAGDSASGAGMPVIESNSPTLSHLPTGYQQQDFSPTLPGVILGTAAYMSPEQARGKTVDRRTDIWALGCVLYELLTGHGPFHKHPSRARQQAVASPAQSPPLRNDINMSFRGSGSDANDAEPDTVQDIIARVLHAEPDWSLLPASTPPGIRTLLRRCLTKDPRQRYHSPADLRIQIEEYGASIGPAISEATAVPQKSGWRRIVVSTFALVGALFIGGIAGWYSRHSTAVPNVARLTFSLPPGQRLAWTILLWPLPRMALAWPMLRCRVGSNSYSFVCSKRKRQDRLLARRGPATPSSRPMANGWDSSPTRQSKRSQSAAERPWRWSPYLPPVERPGGRMDWSSMRQMQTQRSIESRPREVQRSR